MSTSDDYRPRLIVEITQEQHDKLQRLIRWGSLRPAMSILVDTLIEVVEKHGEIALAAIISGDYNILDKLRRGDL